MVELRLPNITGLSEREQLAQLKSYLFQFVGQLQFALNDIEDKLSRLDAITQKMTSESATTTIQTSNGSTSGGSGGSGGYSS